jgi:H+-translocating NAD(P) transhydrogenase subunit beta
MSAIGRRKVRSMTGWTLSNFGALIAKKTAVEITILRIELVLGIWIGAVTFTGSVIAYGKLAGKVDTRPSSCRAGIC